MSQQNPNALSQQPYLPYGGLWAVGGGVLVGMLLRLVFSGEPGGAYSAMDGAFIYLAPQVVGAATVYIAERQQRRSWGYYVSASIAANGLFVLGTLLVLIEGIICAIIIIPFFAVQGVLGGLIMGAVCRLIRRSDRVLYCFTALPLVLGAMPASPVDYDRIRTIERHVVIAASPAIVWHQINNVRYVRTEEVDRGWMYRIGVPLPKSGVTESTHDGVVRRITMGKSMYFDQVAINFQPERHVTWRYRFYPDSIPAGALDDHVRIGGDYFDVIETTYKLIPQAGGSTDLSISMTYRVTTDFNWYADLVARLLIGNFAEVILEFYQRRSQNALTQVDECSSTASCDSRPATGL